MFRNNLKVHLCALLFILAFAVPQFASAQTNGTFQNIGTNEPTLYPNPIKKILTITTTTKAVDVKINIHALDGRLIHTSYHKAEAGKVDVDLSKLNRGLYVLMLTIDNKRTGHKILKD